MLILLINMIFNKLTSNNHQIIFLLLSHYGIYLMYSPSNTAAAAAATIANMFRVVLTALFFIV